MRRQTLFYSFALGIGSLVTGALFVISARTMPPDRFGIVSTALSIAMVAAGIMDFGTNSLWVREMSADRDSGRRVAERMRGKLIGTVVAGMCLAFILSRWLGTESALAGVYFVGLVVAQMSVVPLRARVLPGKVVWCTVVDRTTAVVTMVLTTAFALDPVLRLPAALSCGSFAGALVALLSRPGDAFRGSGWSIRFPWAGSTFFGLTNSVLAIQNLDQAVVFKMAGASAAADLGAVARWMSPIGLIGTALANTAGPIAAQASGIRSAWKMMKPAAIYVILAVVIGTGCSLASPWVVPLLLGQAYSGSIPVFQILAISATVTILNQPVASILQFRGYDRTVCWIMWCGVAVQFALLPPLVMLWGATGSAVASLVCQTFILSFLWWVTRSRSRREMVPA